MSDEVEAPEEEKVQEKDKDVVVYPPCAEDKELENLIKARYNLIYVVTWEERRVIDSLEKICALEEINLSGTQTWDAARGLVGYKNVKIDGGESMTTPEMVLDHIAQKAEELRGKQIKAKAGRGPIYVLCDMFRYLEGGGLTPEIERKIRVLSTLLKRSTITVVMTSPVLQLPIALEKCVTVVDYPLPGKEQLLPMVVHAQKKLLERDKISRAELAKTPIEHVVRSLQGLTIQEAEDAIAKAVVTTKSFHIPTILDIKRGIIRKGGLLDFTYPSENIDDIGGFLGVKQFIRSRRDDFTEHAKGYGLDAPKGIFLLGVQGTGKSLCAKVIAKELQVSLLKLDMGSLFGDLMGESEQNMRRALSHAESIAPCVLFVDEIDQALSGASGPTTDSGTTKRVISKLLNWMQEKVAPVFMVACANSLDGLPPALIRKGRFDELFFVDFPNADERGEIFKIHLRKRKRNPDKFDIGSLVGKTEQYSGAEIEGVIVDAMHYAYGENKREFTANDILMSIKRTKTLSQICKPQIDKLREDAMGRMRSAADPFYANEAEDKDGDGSRFGEL